MCVFTYETADQFPSAALRRHVAVHELVHLTADKFVLTVAERVSVFENLRTTISTFFGSGVATMRAG
jgi:hypothetical protein